MLHCELSGPKTVVVAIIALAGCQRTDTRFEPEARDTPPNTQAKPDDRAQARTEVAPVAVDMGGLANCQPVAEVGTAVARAVDVADADGDGKISKEEAYSSIDLLVGGFFFRSDSNLDGTITPQEARSARAELTDRFPALGAFLTQVGGTDQKPLARLAELLNVDYGQPVTAREMRDAAHQAVDSLYRFADRDKDGNLTSLEARTASWEGARSLGHAAFQSTDTNRDGKLNLEEFRAALDAPTRLAFNASDRNNDGALTETEAAVAMSRFVRSLGLPISKEAGQKVGASQGPEGASKAPSDQRLAAEPRPAADPVRGQEPNPGADQNSAERKPAADQKSGAARVPGAEQRAASEGVQSN